VKTGWGIGLLVCVLLPVALLLFGIVDVAQTAALILLLAGLWTAVFGVVFENANDRFYDVGFGIIVAVLSTFVFLPVQYAAGLVVVSVIGIILASVVIRPKMGQKSAPRQVSR
jgi:predicted membrane protein